jgi:hypothetical protein
MTYMVCRKCRGEYGSCDVRTESSRETPGWMAIVCLECAHDAIQRDQAWDSPLERRGARAIDPELYRAVAYQAKRMANKARNDHDSRSRRAAQL